jgi:uncharacterized protein YaaR (DUF327 family)
VLLKIQQTAGAKREWAMPVKERTAAEQSQFSLLLHHKKELLTKERLSEIINQIEKQSERLITNRTMEELKAYKSLVQDFVKEVVQHGLDLQEKGGFYNGRDRRLLVIKELDKHLLELSNQVLDEQKQTVDLLHKTGEIKGLLINLYL